MQGMKVQGDMQGMKVQGDLRKFWVSGLQGQGMVLFVRCMCWAPFQAKRVFNLPIGNGGLTTV